MENQISEFEADEQEALNKKRLATITKGDLNAQLIEIWDASRRPKESLLELMNWATNIVSDCIPAKDALKINNSKISIDGSFLQFCEENKVKVSCLLQDAVSTWKTDIGGEHFLASGIFKIQTEDVLFFHCALLHKGEKNQDDVSFFIIVNRNSFEKYVNFRNKYSEWLKQRHKDIAEIEVVGGDSILYTRDLTWDSIILEESIKQNIKSSVDGFLKSKDLFEKLQVPWKYALVFWGERGCGKTLCLRVLMSEYKEFKPVTIQTGHPEADELLSEAFTYAQENAPALLFFEDIQEMIKEVNPRHFLQLLDGVQGRDGILIVATGNDLRNLEDNLASRPRRFDKKIEFPLPNEEMSKIYLSKRFSDILKEEEIKKIAKKTYRNKFTYSHLQDLYFNSVFIAVSQDRQEPTKEDINKACDIAIKEKKTADEGFVHTGIVSRRSITDYGEI